MGIYGKLYAYLGRKAHLAWVSMLTAVLSSLAVMGGYWAIYRVLVALVERQDYESAWRLTLTAVGLLAGGALLFILATLLSHLMGFALESALRRRGVDGLSRASFRFFEMHSSGTVRKTIDDNAEMTHVAVAHHIPEFARGLSTLLLAFVLAFTVDWRVGVFVLGIALIGAVSMRLMMGGGEFMKFYLAALERLSAESVEYVRGMQVVKIFGADVRSFRALHEAIQEYADKTFAYTIRSRTPYSVFQWFFFFALGIAVPVGAMMPTMAGTPARLAVLLVMAFLILGTIFFATIILMFSSQNVNQANYAVSSLEKLYEEMGREALSHGSVARVEGHSIAFRNVGFAYRDKRVLDGFNLELAQGKTYALVGPSGSGKSTIAKLLSGFYSLDEGEILIGGRPLTEYSQPAISEAIAFVFQNSQLFKRSIYDNVALARRGATREQVMDALHQAGCDGILSKFPERENTLIGSRGVYLSGGEKQRIAIARALLKDSPIVIMDEASAAIDPDNEYELQRAFSTLMKGRTVVMIAHRLSSITKVDTILYLEDGQVLERGTHQELMAGDTRYRRLQEMYNQANEWRVA